MSCGEVDVEESSIKKKNFKKDFQQALTAISLSPTVREPSLAAGLPWTMAVT